MTPIATFLAERLSEIDELRLVSIYDRSGVTMAVINRARAGQSISASDALALFAALGIDPMTRAVIDPHRVGRLDLEVFALFLVARMSVLNHGTRKAASMMGVSERVVYAIRDCKPVSLGNVLRACAYTGNHPFVQCERLKVAA